MSQDRMIATVGRVYAETLPLPGSCSVVSIRDPDCGPPVFHSSDLIRRRLDLAFHDIDAPTPPLQNPTAEQAEQCLKFVAADDTGLIVCQCDAGVSRSHATMAAILRKAGNPDVERVLDRGTYNRLWYRLLLEAAGLEPEPEPLVSVVVRVKYPRDRVEALQLSLQRQRWDNWEAILVTDGEAPCNLLKGFRTRTIFTKEHRGRWGHPYRQMGIDAARGSYICLANDDNYYVPGFIEQMVRILRREQADLVLCDMLHRYQGWDVCRSQLEPEISTDVAAWMGAADLVKSVPWPGNEFSSDGVYVQRLAEKARKVAFLHKPLVVKN